MAQGLHTSFYDPGDKALRQVFAPVVIGPRNGIAVVPNGGSTFSKSGKTFFSSHEAADEKILEVSLDRSSEGQTTTRLVEEVTRHMLLEVIFADVDFSLSS